MNFSPISFRVICATRSRGITSVSPTMPGVTAIRLAESTKDSSPSWLQVYVEADHYAPDLNSDEVVS